MASYVKVEDMIYFIFKSHTFDRLVNRTIRCCTGLIWNNTIGDCIGTKGFYIRRIPPDLTTIKFSGSPFYKYLAHFINFSLYAFLYCTICCKKILHVNFL